MKSATPFARFSILAILYYFQNNTDYTLNQIFTVELPFHKSMLKTKLKHQHKLPRSRKKARKERETEHRMHMYMYLM